MNSRVDSASGADSCTTGRRMKAIPRTFDQKYATGGLGIPLGGSTMLDLTYARGWWETYRTNYNSTSRVQTKASRPTPFWRPSHTGSDTGLHQYLPFDIFVWRRS